MKNKDGIEIKVGTRFTYMRTDKVCEVTKINGEVIHFKDPNYPKLRENVCKIDFFNFRDIRVMLLPELSENSPSSLSDFSLDELREEITRREDQHKREREIYDELNYLFTVPCERLFNSYDFGQYDLTVKNLEKILELLKK